MKSRVILFFLVFLTLFVYNLIRNASVFTDPSDGEDVDEKDLFKSECVAKTNIVFLKTHKTGSSSVQNVFFRYGDNHNLTFILPVEYSYIGHPQRFNRQMLFPKSQKNNQSLLSKSYNILTHHTRFDYSEMRSVMPIDTIFVTIVRQPVCSIQSLLSFIHLEKFYNETSFNSSLEKYFSTSANVSSYHVLSKERINHKFGRNQMSFDLGFEMKYFDDSQMIKRFVKQIDSQFDLIMITERMEESLILLRHLLCWSLNDIIVFQHNMRKKDLSCHLSTQLQFNIRHFNNADQILYDYFLHKFDRQVLKFGIKRMKNEIILLQNATQTMYNKCVKKTLPMKHLISSNDTWFSDLALGFQPKANTNKICKDLTIYELYYTELLRNKQNNKY